MDNRRISELDSAISVNDEDILLISQKENNEYVSRKIGAGVFRGDSAYDLAVKEGFKGDLNEWLSSIKGWQPITSGEFVDLLDSELSKSKLYTDLTSEINTSTESLRQDINKQIEDVNALRERVITDADKRIQEIRDLNNALIDEANKRIQDIEIIRESVTLETDDRLKQAIELSNQILLEKEHRTDDIKNLVEKLNNEQSDRVSAIEEVISLLNSEVDSRREMVREVADKITEEANQRIKAIDAIQDTINKDQLARVAEIEEILKNIDSLDDQVGTNHTFLLNNYSTTKTANELTAKQIEALRTTYIDPKLEQKASTTALEQITTEVGTINDALQANISKIDGVFAKVNPSMAGTTSGFIGEDSKYVGVWTEQSARIEEDFVLGKRVDNVVATYTSNKETTDARIAREEKARADGDSALASIVTSLTTRVGNSEGKLITLEQVTTDTDSSLSQMSSKLDNTIQELDTKASSSALSDLSSNVEILEDGLKSTTNSVTFLQNSIDTINKDISKKADSSALTELSSKVTLLGDDLSSTSNNITYLASSLGSKNKTYYQPSMPTENVVSGDLWVNSTLGKNNELKRYNGLYWDLVSDPRVSANSSAISSLESTTSQHGDNITSQGKRITDLQSEIDLTKKDVAVKANASALEDLSSKVVNVDGKVTSVSEDLLRLDNTLNQVESNLNLKADSSALRDLTSKVEKTDENLRSQSQDITSLNNSLTTVNTNINTKGKVIYLDTEPSQQDRLPQNLWIDTSDNKNTPKRWNGSEWAVVSDKVALDALSKAKLNEEILTTKADSSAVAALTNKVEAAEKSITSQSTDIVSLKNSLSETVETVGEKGRIIFSSVEPPEKDRSTLNLWIDLSNDSNTPKRWTGTQWEAVSDKVALDALAAANTVTTALATKADASAVSSLDSKVSKINNTVTSQSTDITTLNNSMVIANNNISSKGKIIYSDSAPAEGDRLPQNLWIDTTAGGNIPKRWNGQFWLAVTDKTALDALAAANKAKEDLATKVDSSAFNSLTSRVSSSEKEITSQSDSITKLNNSLTVTDEIAKEALSDSKALKEQITTKASTEALENLSSSVASIDGKVTTNTQKVLELTGTVETIGETLSTKADASVLTDYSTKVDTNEAISNANTTLTSSYTKAVNDAKVETNVKLDDQLLISKASTSGKLLYPDVTFLEGVNSVVVFDRNGTGKVVVSRVTREIDNPTKSSHQLKITIANGATPGYGGFYQPITARANAVFVIKYLMKVPTTYTVVTASNALGSNSSDKIIGSTAGTGKYETYIRVVRCGDSGSFSTGGHLYFYGTSLPAGSTDTIMLASIECWDATDFVKSATSDEVASINATLVNKYYTKTSADQAIADGLTAFQTNYVDRELNKKASANTVEQINNEITNTDTGLKATANKLSGVYAQVNPELIGSDKGFIGKDSGSVSVWSEYSARIEGDTALSSRIDSVKSEWENSLAVVQTQTQTATDQLSSLASQVTVLSSAVDGNLSLVMDQYYTKVQTNDVVSQNIVELKANYINPQLGLKASAQALQETQSQVTEIDGKLKTTSQKTDGVYAQINPELAGNSTGSIGNNTQKVGAWTQYSALIEGDFATAQKIDAVSVEVENNSANIQQINTVVVTNSQAAAEALSKVEVKFNDNLASLSSTIGTWTEEDKSISKYITDLTSVVDNNKADISKYYLTSVDTTKAITEGIDRFKTEYVSEELKKKATAEALDQVKSAIENTETGLVATADKLEGVFVQVNPKLVGSDREFIGKGSGSVGVWTEYSARVEEDFSLGRRVDNLYADLGKNAAAIQTINEVMVDKTQSLAESITNIDSKFESSVGSINTTLGTWTTSESSISDYVMGINSVVGQNSSSIQVQGRSIDGLSSQYTVKIDTNGRVSGFGLASNPTNQATSEFAVVADKFYVASPQESGKGKSPFYILPTQQVIGGVTVPAGTYIDQSFIRKASIDTAHIRDAAIVDAKIFNLDASKITTGFISADRIEAGTIQSKHIGVNAIQPTNFSYEVYKKFNETFVSIDDAYSDGKLTPIEKRSIKEQVELIDLEFEVVKDSMATFKVPHVRVKYDALKTYLGTLDLNSQTVTVLDRMAYEKSFADYYAELRNNQYNLSKEIEKLNGESIKSAKTANDLLTAWKTYGQDTLYIDDTRIAVKMIGAEQIAADSITADKIKFGSVTSKTLSEDVQTDISKGTSAYKTVADLAENLKTKADSSALMTLDHDVTTIEGTVESYGQSLTELNNNYSSLVSKGGSLIADYTLKNPNDWVSRYNYDLKPYFTTVTDGKVASTVFRKPKEVGTCWNYSRHPVTNDRAYKVSMWVRRETGSTGSIYFTWRKYDRTGLPTSSYGNSSVSVVADGNWYQVSTTINDTVNKDTYPQIAFGFALNHSNSGYYADMQGFKVESVISLADADSTVASSSALSSLTSRVTGAEGNITSQGQSITTLQNSVSNLNGTLATKADASALSSLDSKVTSIEGNVSSQGSNIVSLSNSLDTANVNLNAKGKIIYSATVPVAADQLTQNLWIDTTGGANTPKRWSGTAWIAVTDKVATDAANAASAAQNSANQANATITDITSDNKLTPVEKRQVKLIVDDIKQVDIDIKTRAAKYSISTTAYTDSYNTLISYINPILADLTTTTVITRTTFNTNFNNFFTSRAALDTSIVNEVRRISDLAQSTADNKGEVIYSTTTPPANKQLTQNLWIDTANGANTPKRWNGTAWAVVTDKVASDALAAANTANSALASKADASAVESLTNRVTGTEGAITTQSSKVVTLENSLSTTTATANKALTAVTVADTRSTNELPSWYWSNYPKRVVNEFKTASAIGVTGLGTYVNLETRVYYSDSSGGPIIQTAYSPDNMLLQMTRKSTSTTAWTVWSQPLKSLSDTVNTKADASAVSNLDSKVTNIDGKVAANASNITSLQGNVTTINNNLATKADASALSDYYTIVQADEAISGKVEEFKSTYSESILPIAKDTSRANTWSRIVYSKKAPYIGTNVVPDYSYLVNYKKHSEDYFAEGRTTSVPINNSINYYRAVITVSSAKVIDLGNLTGDDAHAVYVDNVKVHSASSYSTNPCSFEVTAGEHIIDIIVNNGGGAAGFSSTKTLSSQVDSMYAVKLIYKDTELNASAISSTDSKVTTVDGKLTVTSKSVSDLTTTVGQNTANISTVASSVDGIKSEYSVKLNVNGKVSGFGLISGPKSSDFSILSDTFKVSNGTTDVAPFSVINNEVIFNGKVSFTNITDKGWKITVIGTSAALPTTEQYSGTYIDNGNYTQDFGTSGIRVVIYDVNKNVQLDNLYDTTTAAGCTAFKNAVINLNLDTQIVTIRSVGFSLANNQDLIAAVNKLGFGGSSLNSALTYNTKTSFSGISQFIAAKKSSNNVMVINADVEGKQQKAITSATIKDGVLIPESIPMDTGSHKLNEAADIAIDTLTPGMNSLNTSVGNAQATANSKSKTFTAQPTVPYSMGDLWKNGTTVLVSTVSRATGSFTSADWIKVGDVTSENTAKDTTSVNGVSAATVATNAQTGKTLSDNIMSDLVITPVEKSGLSNEWNRIKAEYATLSTQASSLAVDKTALDSAYTTLNGVSPRIETEVLVSMVTNYTLTTTTRDSFKSKLNTYYQQATAVSKNITNAVNNLAATAQSTANSKAKTFTATPTIPYSLGDIWKNGNAIYVSTVNRLTGSYTASDWVLTGDVTSLNTSADTSKVNGIAASTVTDNAAKGLSVYNDVMSDLKITPVEKTAINQEWNRIQKEYASLVAQATSLSIPTTTLTAAYNGLSTTDPAMSTILASMSTTTTLTAAQRDAYKAQYTTYYTQAVAMVKAINEKIADNAKADLDNLEIGGRNLIVLSAGGIEESKYLNATGAVTSSTNWFVTDNIPVTPGTSYILSGYRNLGSAPSTVFYDASGTYISGIAGTARRIVTAPVNATSMRVSLEKADKPTIKLEKGNKATDWTPAPEDVDIAIASKAKTFVTTPTVPYSIGDIWKEDNTVKVCTTERLTGVYTASDWTLVGDVTANNTAADTAKVNGINAATVASNAAKGLKVHDDVMSDLIITPVEKTFLNTEWNRIKAEYANLISQASGLGITATTLTNAYNAVNTTAPSMTTILSSMVTSTTLTTTERNNFRTQLDTYYKQAVAMTKSIADKIAENAKAEVDNLVIGGINLALDSNKVSQNNNGSSHTITMDTTGAVYKFTNTGTSTGISTYTTQFIETEIGKEYTVSLKMKASKSCSIQLYTSGTIARSTTLLPASSWITIWSTFKATAVSTRLPGLTTGGDSVGFPVGTVVEYKEYKFEEGTKVTAWCPNAKDLEDQIATKAQTFTAQPVTPYTAGDLWRNGSAIYVCTNPRASGSYTASDWTLAGDVTANNTSADTAKVNGISAATVTNNAAKGLAVYDDVMSDLKITPVEKNAISQEWNRIQAEYAKYLEQATSLGLATSAYSSAYTALATASPSMSSILSSMTTTTTLTAAQRDAYRSQYTAYYTQTANIVKEINNKIAVNADTNAKTIANNIRIGGTNLFPKTLIKRGYHLSSGNLSTLTSTNHVTYDQFLATGSNTNIIYQVWNDSAVSSSNSNRVCFYDSTKTYISQVTMPLLSASTPYQVLKIAIPSTAAFVKLGAIAGASSFNDNIKIKFEFGDNPTDWSIAPEDIQNKLEAFVTDNTGNLLNNTVFSGTVDKWSAGTVTSQAFFNTTVPVHTITSTGNTISISDKFTVDPSKAYEVSAWFKADSAVGSLYLGLYAFNKDGTNIGLNEISRTTGADTSTANTNFYFQSTSGAGLPLDWVKWVGYIMPAGTASTDMKGIGSTTSNARMLPNTAQMQVRWLNYGNSSTTTSTKWAANFKCVEVDPNSIIAGVGAKYLADSKAQVYTTTPTTPYSVGDIWKNGTTVYVCSVAKAIGAAYSVSDWIKVGDVTSENTAKDVVSVSGVASATVANNAQAGKTLSDNVMSDLVITPVEKSSLLTEWNRIKAEYTNLYNQAIALNISTVDLAAAYTALDGTTPKIASEILVSMTTNYTLTTATRDALRTKLNTYFSKATDMSVNITSTVNASAATAQITADSKAKVFTATPTVPYTIGDVWRNGNSLYVTTVNRTSGSYTAADWVKVSDLTSENVAKDVTSVNGTAAATVVDNAAKGLSVYNDVMSDLKITPVEKTAISQEWSRIQKEYASLLAQAQTLGLTTTAYTSAYTGLSTTAPAMSTILASMSTTTTLTAAQRDAYRSQYTAYYTQSAATVKAINDKIASNAKTDLDNLEIGGRNLFQQSNYGKHSHNGSINSSATSAIIKVEPNTTYTISYKVTTSNRFGIYQGNLENGILTNPILNISTIIAYRTTTPDTLINSTFTTSAVGEYIMIYLSYDIGQVKEPFLKVEKGNKATDWSPAPEDVDIAIESKSKTFVTTPTVPYSVGDLWKDGDAVKVCTTARLTGTYTTSDWTLAGDVTSNNTSADTAKVNGVAAATVATNAQAGKTLADNVMSDLIITPVEKSSLLTEWNRIKAEYNSIVAQATALSVDKTALTTAYTALDTTSPKIASEILANMTTNYVLTTTTRDAFKAQLNTYFVQATAVTKAITDKVNSLLGIAQDTADSKAKTFTSTPTVPYSAGDIWRNGNTIYVSTVTRATGSYTAADWTKASDVTSENTSANTSSVGSVSAASVATLVSDMSNDSKLIPSEKRALNAEWERIKNTYPALITQAVNLGAIYTRTAYDALAAYIPSLALTSQTTTAIVATTFRTNFSNYYVEEATILKNIQDKQRTDVIAVKDAIPELIFAQGGYADSKAIITINGVNQTYTAATGILVMVITQSTGVVETKTIYTADPTGFSTMKTDITALASGKIVVMVSRQNIPMTTDTNFRDALRLIGSTDIIYNQYTRKTNNTFAIIGTKGGTAGSANEAVVSVDGNMNLDNATTSGTLIAGKLSPNSTTFVDGGLILTNSINANSIKAGSITAAQIEGGSITGDKIKAGTVTADKIDSKGLTIKDTAGNVLLGAGTGLNVSNITGLGGFATVNKLTTSNITTYVDGLAVKNLLVGDAQITNANIGTAEVDTLNIRGQAVTVTSAITQTTFFDAKTSANTDAIYLYTGGVSVAVEFSLISCNPEGSGSFLVECYVNDVVKGSWSLTGTFGYYPSMFFPFSVATGTEQTKVHIKVTSKGAKIGSQGYFFKVTGLKR